MNFRDRFQGDDEVVKRAFDLDPIETNSLLIDFGAEGEEEYSVEGNKVIGVVLKPNLRFDIDKLFKSRSFNSIKEAKEYHRKFVEKLDELILEYEL